MLFSNTFIRIFANGALNSKSSDCARMKVANRSFMQIDRQYSAAGKLTHLYPMYERLRRRIKPAACFLSEPRQLLLGIYIVSARATPFFPERSGDDSLKA